MRYGSEYGGWVIPTSLLTERSICYCAGVGEDITFDLALIKEVGCQVFAFDPTPKAKDHVKKNASQEDNFHFMGVAVWSSDTMLRLFAPRDPSHVSYSALNLQGTVDHIETKARRIGSLMREFGHSRLDLLKLDIEGAEYEVLGNVLDEGIAPRVICVEFDQPMPFRMTISMTRRLRGNGYELVNIDDWNYTFVDSSITR